MKVSLVASTALNTEYLNMDENFRETLDLPEQATMEMDPLASDADILSEFAGRACYQSFHKPNPATKVNADYLANTIRQDHNSILEHASATFYVTGVSRALTHELIRHRHLSYSELSQRFVNIEETEFVTPPAIDTYWEADTGIEHEHVEGNEPVTVHEFFDGVNEGAREAYGIVVKALESTGMLSRKQIREAARGLMPNATETRIVVTGNMRAWRDVIKRRFSVHADREICEFSGKVLELLRVVAPSTFADFPSEPFN